MTQSRTTPQCVAGAARRSVVSYALVLASVAVSVTMILLPSSDKLGVDPFWAWFLTACQVSSLAGIGRGYRVGWVAGAAIQGCWITYALLTEQYGFAPGCAVSLVIQAHNYWRNVRAEKAPEPG